MITSQSLTAVGLTIQHRDKTYFLPRSTIDNYVAANGVDATRAIVNSLAVAAIGGSAVDLVFDGLTPVDVVVWN